MSKNAITIYELRIACRHVQAMIDGPVCPDSEPISSGVSRFAYNVVHDILLM